MAKGTTVWVDKETRDNIKKLAELNGRTEKGQIRWMVELAMSEIIPNKNFDGEINQSKLLEEHE